MKKGIILIILLCSILIYDINVKADTYLNPINVIWKDGAGNNLPSYGYDEIYFQSATASTQNGNFTPMIFQGQIDVSNSHGSYIEIPLEVRLSDNYMQNNTTFYTCITWYDNGNGNYTCNNYSNSVNHNISTLEGHLSIQAISVFTNGYVDVCNVDFSNSVVRCPVASTVDYNTIQDIRLFTNYYFSSDYQVSGRTYSIGFGKRVKIYKSGNAEIIENQNQNTETIIESNTTYNNNATQDYTNQTNEMDNITNAEDTLMNNLDFNTTDMNITINPNASTFIWNIVDALRLMSTKIVLLMTSILSIGVIKLVLNR